MMPETFITAYLLTARQNLQDLQLQTEDPSKSQQTSKIGIQQARRSSFLDLPYDVRFEIYSAFFAIHTVTETKHHGNSTVWDTLRRKRGNTKRRANAQDKLPILLTRKRIFTEAAPLFHRLHLFRVPILDEAYGPSPEIAVGVKYILQKLERIALFYEKGTRDSSRGTNVSKSLALLPQCCPQLKELSVEVQLGSRAQFSKKLLSALRSVWTHLEYLRLTVSHPVRKSRIALLPSIAPGVQLFQQLDDGGVRPYPCFDRMDPKATVSILFFDRRRTDGQVDEPQRVQKIESRISGSEADDGSDTTASQIDDYEYDYDNDYLDNESFGNESDDYFEGNYVSDDTYYAFHPWEGRTEELYEF